MLLCMAPFWVFGLGVLHIQIPTVWQPELQLFPSLLWRGLECLSYIINNQILINRCSLKYLSNPLMVLRCSWVVFGISSLNLYSSLRKCYFFDGANRDKGVSVSVFLLLGDSYKIIKCCRGQPTCMFGVIVSKAWNSSIILMVNPWRSQNKGQFHQIACFPIL